MPPRQFSRYSFTAALEDAAGRQILTAREFIRFEERPDNRYHLVREGDSIFGLASLYFDGFTDRPDGFWWAIADFQPVPIHDPTVQLSAGSTIVVPSVAFLVERVFDAGRRREALG